MNATIQTDEKRPETTIASLVHARDKFQTVIRAMATLKASEQFASKELDEIFDRLMGARTRGEEWDVIRILKHQDIYWN